MHHTISVYIYQNLYIRVNHIVLPIFDRPFFTLESISFKKKSISFTWFNLICIEREILKDIYKGINRVLLLDAGI